MCQYASMYHVSICPVWLGTCHTDSWSVRCLSFGVFWVRERRADLLSKWRVKGGIFLIGYAAFRNLSLGRHVKDRSTASEICHALHVNYQYVDWQLSDGIAKIDRRRSIEGEIDRRRSIEGEKGKGKKKKKKKKKREVPRRPCAVAALARGLAGRKIEATSPLFSVHRAYRLVPVPYWYRDSLGTPCIPPGTGTILVPR
ncbi:hypothetical protein GW17_00006236 [Ensete ventricosum]|nr:hypothetical protein GW17_00006236 [Ensete ventricosum]